MEGVDCGWNQEKLQIYSSSRLAGQIADTKPANEQNRVHVCKWMLMHAQVGALQLRSPPTRLIYDSWHSE